jgi:hypothetical protein
MHDIINNIKIYSLVSLETAIRKYSSKAYFITLTVYEVWTNPDNVQIWGSAKSRFIKQIAYLKCYGNP